MAIERFIALPIISVSSVPEAPTSIPLTISTFSCRTKPVAEAAMPVKALSSEITTGMSAPPIGSTKSTPKTSAAAISGDDEPLLLVPATTTTASVTAAPMIAALPNFWPG